MNCVVVIGDPMKLWKIMILPFVLFALALVADGQPVEKSSRTGEDGVFSYEILISNCDEAQIRKWSMDYHNCFFERKYKDDGKNLNSIVDRIFTHAEACMESSRQSCRPDYTGFEKMMSNVISQIKSYSELYLEEIRSGREDIKDLKCVENILTLETYKSCFQSKIGITNIAYDLHRRNINEGISCASLKNRGCSNEAKSALNRITRTLTKLEQPKQEDAKDMEPTPEPAKEMKWYDYIAYPFVSAWNAVKSWFG